MAHHPVPDDSPPIRNHRRIEASLRVPVHIPVRQVSMIDRGQPALIRGAPYFPVADVARAGAWYVEALGFSLEYSAGEPPEFAVYSRSDCPIMFRRVSDPGLIRPNEAQGGTWDVFYWVDAVDDLHAEFAGKRVDVVYGPLEQPYGIREFAIRDPNGYVLGFGQSVGG